MRIRNFSGSKDLINKSKYVIKEPEKYKNKWSKYFKNENPIHLEIGMGKGAFLLKNALEYPNINFIGVEKYSTIVARAIQKIEEYELSNLCIIRLDALELENIFDHEIDTIYLNFSDPWPKDRHSKRRLTSDVFLRIYDNLFKNNCLIIQKTDNLGLFESSINSLTEYGYKVINQSRDLHNSDIFNLTTEYEDKFSSKKVKINYLKALK